MQRPRQTDQSIVVNSARRVIKVFYFAGAVNAAL